MITALIAFAALGVGLVAGGWLGFEVGYHDGIDDAGFRRSADCRHYWQPCRELPVSSPRD